MWNDEAVKMGGLRGIKHPTNTRMLATIAPERGFSRRPIVRHHRQGRGSHRGTAGEAIGLSGGSQRSGEVHLVKRTLWTYPMSTHALVKEGKSSAYIGGGVAIGEGTLVGGSVDGGGLAGCKLLG